MAVSSRALSFSRAVARAPHPSAGRALVAAPRFCAMAAKSTKIYGVKYSTCTKRVLAALEEKYVTDYEVVTVDVSKGTHKAAEFKTKQPFGLIPVLEDDEVLLFESRAIARYVAERYADQGTNLLGSTLKERALVNQWLEVESQNFNPPAFGILLEKVFKLRRGLAADLDKAAEHNLKLAQVLDIYELHLASNDYLAGSFFSLADLVHLPYTAMLWVTGDSDVITSRPNVNKWWERISSRPSWQKVWALK